ncbi:hypothetical protein YT1_3854 [Rhodococcus ruber]|nr:hypothetical protein YT1_3854 [Rhodococcus ruber]
MRPFGVPALPDTAQWHPAAAWTAGPDPAPRHRFRARC